MEQTSFEFSNLMPRKLKRAVIKEELVELTGDYLKALILNQFIYWSERIKDHDKFLSEEAERMKTNGQVSNVHKQHGWIYKKAEELSNELMLGVSEQTIRRNLKFLIEKGWINERRNPNYSWDKTLQYRVDFMQVMIDLRKLGFHLEGYENLNALIESNLQIGASKIQFGGSNIQTGDSMLQNDNSKFQNGDSYPQIGASNHQNGISNIHHGGAIPEITSKTNSEINSKDLNDRMGAYAQVAVTSENHDPFYDTLKQYLSTCYIANEITMSDYHIFQIYMMLQKNFQFALDVEIVRRACLIYRERTNETDMQKLEVKMKFDLENPVGFFHRCYADAVAQYKMEQHTAYRK